MLPWWVLLLFIGPLWLALLVLTRNINRLTKENEKLLNENTELRGQLIYIVQSLQQPQTQSQDTNLEDTLDEMRELARQNNDFRA